MSNLSSDISSLVLKRAVKGDLGQMSLDSKMLQVLMELDGKKTLGQVAQSLDMNMATMRSVIAKLHKLKLFTKVEKAVPMAGKDFTDTLIAQLSVAMGPIAEVLVEDEIIDMGLQPFNVPKHRAAELVELLARQIPREEKRVTFQQAMLQKIKTL